MCTKMISKSAPKTVAPKVAPNALLLLEAIRTKGLDVPATVAPAEDNLLRVMRSFMALAGKDTKTIDFYMNLWESGNPTDRDGCIREIAAEFSANFDPGIKATAREDKGLEGLLSQEIGVPQSNIPSLISTMRFYMPRNHGSTMAFDNFRAVADASDDTAFRNKAVMSMLNLYKSASGSMSPCGGLHADDGIIISELAMPEPVKRPFLQPMLRPVALSIAVLAALGIMLTTQTDSPKTRTAPLIEAAELQLDEPTDARVTGGQVEIKTVVIEAPATVLQAVVQGAPTEGKATGDPRLEKMMLIKNEVLDWLVWRGAKPGPDVDTALSWALGLDGFKAPELKDESYRDVFAGSAARVVMKEKPENVVQFLDGNGSRIQVLDNGKAVRPMKGAE